MDRGSSVKCRAEGCDHYVKYPKLRLCGMHYTRYYKYGDIHEKRSTAPAPFPHEKREPSNKESLSEKQKHKVRCSIIGAENDFVQEVETTLYINEMLDDIRKNNP